MLNMSDNNQDFNNETSKYGQFHKHIRPGAKTGIVSTTAYLLDKIVNSDEGENVSFIEKNENKMEVMNVYSGTSEGLLDVGKSHYATANLAELKAGNEEIGVKTSVLSATAHCEYGLQNSIGVDASLVRAEGHLGPIKVGTGVSLDCNASIGLNGVEATVLGTGFSVGPKIAVKTPFVDLSVNLF